VLRYLALAVTLMSATAFAQLPADWKIEGQFKKDGGITATGETRIRAAVKEHMSLEATVRLGRIGETFVLRVGEPNELPAELTLTARDGRKSPWVWKKETVEDACIEVRLRRIGKPILFSDDYWIRPNPHFYHKDDLKKVLAEWKSRRSATEAVLRIRVERRSGTTRFWLDDRFIGRTDGGYGTVTFVLRPGNSVLSGRVVPVSHTEGYEVLRLGGYKRAGKPGGTNTSPGPGRHTLDGIPFDVAAPQDSIDVGISRWLEENKGPDGFTDDYFTRSAFDGTPESIILAVPNDDYCYAHILCAVAPDPTKTPVLSLRLTRFLEDLYDSGGRGEAIADTVVRIERAAGRWPDSCRPVGTAELDTRTGKVEVPLIHVAARLKSGEIQDVLDETGMYYRRSAQYLDLELTRELHLAVVASHANYSVKPLGKPSAVRVFAVTLERSPVRVRVGSNRPGNIFYTNESPALNVSLTNLRNRPFEGMLACETTDLRGESRKTESKVRLDVGDAKDISMDIARPRVGFYRAVVRLTEDDGRLIWEHPTTFALLPPDTRTAGRESPFGVWWFRRTHVGTDSIDEIGPLMRRLGVRHVCPGRRGPSAEELAKYGITVSMLRNVTRKPEQAAKFIAEQVEANPGVKWAMIFHESGFKEKITFPPEFLGRRPPKLTPEQEKKFKQLWDTAVSCSKIYREQYPDIKLIFGNGSLPFAVEFMRRGYPREYVDAFGDEDLGQLIMPEAPPQAFKSVYWLKEYAKMYGYDVPVTSAFEWRARPTTPGNLTEAEQAELYVRDYLQGLAFRMPHINVGLIHDTGDAYYYSRWGGTGLCHRYPLLNPKISYVAVATLTRELDRARYIRSLESNSPSLYVMEFERGNEKIYAMWIPRGQRSAVLAFDRDTELTLTDMTGGTRQVAVKKGEATVTVSSSPIYLRGRAALAKVEAGPTTCEPPPRDVKCIDDMNDLARWITVEERDAYLEETHFDYPRRQGKFELRVVEDPQKGKVTELRLLPQPDVPWVCPRYIILEAEKPIEMPGRPSAVGMWVKGNSCWGRVMWEFEDAKGEKFLSIGAPCGGWSVGDWKCRTFINFDGWNYLQVRLPTWYESGFYGPEHCDWRCVGGDGRVDFLIKFTRLVVELRERVVHLTDSIPVPDRAVRLARLSVSFD